MYSVVIACAGKGERTNLNINKLLYQVEGIHLIEHTISNFMYDPEFTEIILVVNAKEIERFKQFTSNKIKLVVGGETRQKSVYNGVKQANNDIVFVHDGARPLISQKIINDCKNSLKVHDACVVALTVTDSLKKLVDGKLVTIERTGKYLMQTPQCARKDVLLASFEKAFAENYTDVDEIGLLVRYSDIDIKIVDGSKKNLKITFFDDIQLFERLNNKL